MTRQTDYLSFILPFSLSVPNTQVMDIEMASPVGPVVAPAYHQGHEFGIPVSHLVTGRFNHSALLTVL